MKGCKSCGKQGNGIRYCNCSINSKNGGYGDFYCCCCHVGYLCIEDRDKDKWTHYWQMMDNDLIPKPQNRPSKSPKTTYLTPCNEGKLHHKLRTEWNNPQ